MIAEIVKCTWPALAVLGLVAVEYGVEWLRRPR